MSKEKTKVEKMTDKAADAKLTSAAKEINVRLEKAAQIEGKADDHRLAAALKLAEARGLCKQRKIKFKEWCEANVQKSYDEVRKLVAIGTSEDPPKALEDLRAGNAKRNKEARARKSASRDTQAVPPAEGVAAALASMDSKKAVAVIEEAAKERGYAVVSDTVAKHAAPNMTALERAVFAFDELTAQDKLRLMQHAAEKTGAKITLFDQPLETHIKKDPEPAPAKKGGRRKKAA